MLFYYLVAQKFEQFFIDPVSLSIFAVVSKKLS